MGQKRSRNTWRHLLAAAAFALAACTGGEGITSSEPVIPLGQDPLFTSSGPANGSGQCLLEDTKDAGFINNPKLNCTSEDVDVALAAASQYRVNGGSFMTLASTGGKILCSPGDIVDVDGSAQVINHAQERYDVGLWVGLNGADALTATGANACNHYNLVNAQNNSTNIDGAPDQCGDVAAGVVVDVPLGLLSGLLCVDGDPDPDVVALVISACAAWQNHVGQEDRICPSGSGGSFRLGTTPENAAKCKCEPLSLPLDVRGSIRITKNAVPDDAQNFAFTTIGSGLSSFNLDDDADPALSNTQLFSNLVSGTYTVDEAAVAGWDLTALSCTTTGSGTSASTTLATGVASITLGAGGTVHCTYTNTKQGQITIVKDAIPDDAQNFAFNGNITGCTSFDLDDDADPALSNQKVCAVAPGTFNVAETAVANWVQTSAVCSDGSPVTAIVVSAGENITCTFTNTKNGQITIVKDAQPDDPQNFAFNGNITGCTSFNLDDDADPALSNQRVCAVAPGTFNVAESAVAGWTNTSATCSDGSPVTAIAVSAGENITCTFTNVKGGSITIVKNAIPDDAQNFAFNGNITGCTSFDLDDDADPALSNQRVCAVAPGTFNVAETPVANWVQTSAVCSDGSPVTAIEVSAGENITCTFTNTKNGQITIVKDAIPDDAQNFAFNGNITGCTSFDLDDDADPTLSNQKVCAVAPGTFNVAETAVAGWNNTSATCSDGSPVTAIAVSAGENITCTFTNVKGGSITIVKDAIPDDAQNFAFNGNITGCTSFDLDDDADPGLSNQKVCAVAPGTFNVAETAVANWVQTSAVCSDGSPVTAIVVSAGENITCTFTNTKNGQITIVKDAQPDDPQNFAFNGNITGCTSFNLDDDADPALSNQRVCAVAPGTFNVAESAVAGWTNTSATCSDGSPVTAIAVSAGENITCTFTNVKLARVQVIKTVSGSPVTGSHTFVFTLRQGATASASGTTLESITANSINGGTLNFATFLTPGATYQICEAIPSGWTSSISGLAGAFAPSTETGTVCVPFTPTAGQTVVFNIDNTPPALGAVLLIIDEDGIDNGLHVNKTGGPIVPGGPHFFSPGDVNENNSSESQRGVLPFFANNVGLTITVKTGNTNDEGWFAPNCIPAKFLPAFNKENNDCLTNGDRDLAIDNFFGLNGSGAIPSQERLDKIPHLIPLRALGLSGLIGKTVCAVVYDSDIGINYDHNKPLGVNGKLQGETYGIVAFDVIAVNTLNGFSSSTLPQVTILIRDPAVVCGTWSLYSAPVPTSSSVPNDRVAPGSPAGYMFVPPPPLFF